MTNDAFEITLYGVAVSAFVAKVRIVLDHKGLAHAEAPPPGGYGSSEYRAIVPAGSVPGIVIDGRALHDSNAIVEYLEEIAPEPPLTPKDPFERAEMRALLGFHDTRLEASARALFPLVKRDWRADPAAVEAGAAGVAAVLERLERLVAPSPFHLGGRPSLADLAYPVTLQMTALLLEEVERPLRLTPKIADWRDAAAELPAVARSLTIAGRAMEAWLAGFRNS